MGDSFANKYKKSNLSRPNPLILAFIVFIYILLSASLALAVVDVTLEWDASSGADGYRLFYREDGQSYNYSSPAWEGPETTCTIYGLDDSSSYHFVARAYNAEGESGDSNDESTTIGSTNQPPVLDPIGSKSVDEGDLLIFAVTASDPDGDGLTFSVSNVPTDASFNPSTRIFSWTPAFGDAGNYNVTFTVNDNGTTANSDDAISAGAAVFVGWGVADTDMTTAGGWDVIYDFTAVDNPALSYLIVSGGTTDAAEFTMSSSDWSAHVAVFNP